MEQNLHIISPQAPNVLENIFSHDLYYLIQELNKNGIHITLHIPFYEQLDPKTYDCISQLFRYKNPNDLSSADISFQFIQEAVENIQASKGPILYCGNLESLIHLNQLLNGKRKIFYRMLSDEIQSAKDLVQIHRWGLGKIKKYFRVNKLTTFLKKLDTSDIHCLVDNITALESHSPKTEIPLFTGMPFAYFNPTKGSFCLFHGNLNEKENEYAAFWLLEHVFNTLEIPFVIAGSNPSDELEKAAHLRMHTCLVANPTDSELHELIKKAQVNLLPSFVSKRRDMNLYQCLNLGKHILTNSKGIPSQFKKESITIAENPDEFIKQVSQLFERTFNEEDYNKRMETLNGLYQDQISAQKFISLLS